MLLPNFSGREIFSFLYTGKIRIFVMSKTGFGLPSGQYAFDIFLLISFEESATEISPLWSLLVMGLRMCG
jgi:hypothetical protein